MLYIIGGKHKKRQLRAPKSSAVRPTASRVREMVFNICQHQIEGASFLDLFAGSGAMGLEALSRGATHATFVESAARSVQAIKQNIEALKEELHTTLIGKSVHSVLPTLAGSFDLIYVDPPYGKSMGTETLALLDRFPLLAEEGSLFIEDAFLEIPDLNQLKLKKKRPIGRAFLYEFALKNDPTFFNTGI